MGQHAEMLVRNAGELLTARSNDGAPVRGAAVDEIEVIRDGAFVVSAGRILDIGRSDELAERYRADREIDAEGRLVTPAFSDAHTHLVHGGSRHRDWEDRVLERPARGIGGGILSTLRHTAEESDAELRDRALDLLDEMLVTGTTAVEAKSGYGLSPGSELRLLRILRDLSHPVAVVPTYLGAHTVPARCADDREAYVREVIDTLPAARELAETCDVAVDPVSFTADEGERIMRAALAEGFALRVHADQTADAGGTALAAALGAVTVDHLDHVNDAALAALAASRTIGVLFPAANFHLLDGVRSLADPDSETRDLPAWARRLRDSGAALALSTDYNPGTATCTSMQDVMRLAIRLYRWSAAAVWNLATINAAHALGAGERRGSLAVGKDADFIIWSVREHGEVPYRVGGNLARSVFRAGRLVAERGRVCGVSAGVASGAPR